MHAGRGCGRREEVHVLRYGAGIMYQRDTSRDESTVGLVKFVGTVLTCLLLTSCMGTGAGPRPRAVAPWTCADMLVRWGADRTLVEAMVLPRPVLEVCARFERIQAPMTESEPPSSPAELHRVEDARFAVVDPFLRPRVCDRCGDVQHAEFYFVRAMTLQAALRSVDAQRRLALALPPFEDRTVGMLRLPMYLASRAYDDARRCAEAFTGVPQPLRDACARIVRETSAVFAELDAQFRDPPEPTRAACGYEPLVVPGRAVRTYAEGSSGITYESNAGAAEPSGPTHGPIWLTASRRDHLDTGLFSDEVERLRRAVAAELRRTGREVVEDDIVQRAEADSPCDRPVGTRMCATPGFDPRVHRAVSLSVYCFRSDDVGAVDAASSVCSMQLHARDELQQVAIRGDGGIASFLQHVPALVAEPPNRGAFGNLIGAGIGSRGPAPLPPVHRVDMAHGDHGGPRLRLQDVEFEQLIDPARDALMDCGTRHGLYTFDVLFEFDGRGVARRHEALPVVVHGRADRAVRSCLDRALGRVDGLPVLAGHRYAAFVVVDRGGLRSIHPMAYSGDGPDAVAIHEVRLLDTNRKPPSMSGAVLQAAITTCVTAHAPTTPEIPISIEGTTPACGAVTGLRVTTPIPALTRCIEAQLDPVGDPCGQAPGPFRLDLCARPTW